MWRAGALGAVQRYWVLLILAAIEVLDQDFQDDVDFSENVRVPWTSASFVTRRFKE